MASQSQHALVDTGRDTGS